MFLYLAIFILCIFSFFLDHKEKGLFSILIIVLLCLISGNRYEMGGSDYFVYEQHFLNTPNIIAFFNLLISNREELYKIIGCYDYGHLFFISLVKSLGFNYYGYILLHAVVFYSLFWVGLRKYCKDFSIIIPIFLYKLFFYNTFISLRQSTTIAIFLYSIRYIETKSFFKYYTSILIACSFHIGAFFLLPCYFLTYVKIKRVSILLCFIFLFIILTPLFQYLITPNLKYLEYILAEKHQGWLQSDESLSFLHTLEYFLILAFALFNFKKLKKIPYFDLFFNIFIVLLPIMTTFRNMILFTRIKDYFTISYGIILTMALNNRIPQDKNLNLVTKFSITIICLLGLIKFVLGFDSGHFLTYKSFLLEGKSIFF